MAADRNEMRVTEAIEKLWSADNEERLLGKNELRCLGDQSAGPLVALLENLVRNPFPLFSKGNEEKGKEAIEGLRRVFRTASDLVGAHQQIELYSQLIKRLAINSRLLGDIIELLGNARSEAAVPVLIEIMVSERGMNNFSTNPMYPEMEALCRIGNVAVPKLIEVLENAKQRAANNSAYPSFMIEIDMPKLPEPVAEPEDKDDSADISFEANIIIRRAAKVLGTINDSRALPSLEKVLFSNDVGLARGAIEQAIENIKSS
jgi:HEAT repeat protein